MNYFCFTMNPVTGMLIMSIDQDRVLHITHLMREATVILSATTSTPHQSNPYNDIYDI